MMQSGNERRRAWILLGGCAVLMGVGGLLAAVSLALTVGAYSFSESLHPDSDIVDVSREEVALKGYTVPVGAEHVSVRDRALQDVRVTWFQFELRGPARRALEAEYMQSERHRSGSWTGALPDAWPPFHTLAGFTTPPWWAPQLGSTSYLREARGRGAMIVFGDGVVHHILWTCEWWEPPEPSGPG